MAAITRSDFRNALFTLLDAQKTATPDQLRKVLPYRPGGIGEKPVAWVGQVVDRLTFDAGTRSHNLTAEVVCATTFPSDSLITTDPFDALLDALIERFTGSPTVIPVSILTLTGIDDGEVSFVSADGTTTIYRGATLTISLQVWEGRQ